MQTNRSKRGLGSMLAASVAGLATAVAGNKKQTDSFTDSVDAFGNALRGNPPQSEQDKAAAYRRREERASLAAARKSKFPSTNALAHMDPEKRMYWENRIENDSSRGLWSRPRRPVPHSKMPSTLTRQLRRQQERREGKMPLGMYSETWLKQLRGSRA